MKNYLKYFYSPSSLKRKILDIIDDIKDIVKPISPEKFGIEWYGAYYINPGYLVIWICVESDKAKLELESNKVLTFTLKELFTKHKYPVDAIPFVQLGFESQETVNRESGGDWHLHFQ